MKKDGNLDQTQKPRFSEDVYEQTKADHIFDLLNSVEEMNDWFFTYFGLRFPQGTIYPDSTHGPADAIWRIYELIKTGQSAEIPEVVLYSSRDSGKTVAASAAMILCLIHFRFSVALASATLDQTQKPIQYNNQFFNKISPYLKYHGWKQIGDSKSKIEWILPDGEQIYVRVLPLTRKGMNSEHLPMLFCDEIDLVQDTQALDEAKMVPTSYKGFSPLMVSLSTMKYSGGNMEKKVKTAISSGGEVFKWNILDVAKSISEEEAQTDKPMVVRYLRELPFGNLTEDQWLKIPEKDQIQYERTEVYAGIQDHPLLPVMKNLLVGRQTNNSPIYKTHTAILNNFKQVSSTSIEMVAAQLLCKKPSSAGLVYPRFGFENVLTTEKAYSKISGENIENVTLEDLKTYLQSLGVSFIGGMDFGFTDYTSMVVLALLPNGEIWLVDSFLANQIELDDIIKYGQELNTIWGVDRWYVDNAYPAYVKTLKRAGLRVPDFKKVVEDGISAVQFKICNSTGTRKFFIISQPNNEHIPDCFSTYSWQKDRKGDPIEGKPHHDNEHISDVMDSIRYPMQVLFGKSGKKPMISTPSANSPHPFSVKKQEKPQQIPSIGSEAEKNSFKSQVADHILRQTGVQISKTKDLSQKPLKKGKVFWSK
jgi:hypothetical protein